MREEGLPVYTRTPWAIVRGTRRGVVWCIICKCRRAICVYFQHFARISLARALFCFREYRVFIANSQITRIVAYTVNITIVQIVLGLIVVWNK